MMNFKLLLAFLLVGVLLADSADAWGRRRRSSRRRRWSLPWTKSCTIQTNSGLELDRHLAKKLMTYSAIAYNKTGDLRRWDCPLCVAALNKNFLVVGTVANEPKHLFAFVGYDPVLKAILMVFRGSDGLNWKNWFKVNLLLFKEKPSALFQDAGTVHKGFYSAYLAIRNHLNALVDKAIGEHGNHRLIVTGHSLGGALATIAALDQKVNRRRDVTMMNFGSPRVGSECFAAYYSKQLKPTYRVAHTWDPVCSVPPKLSGYRHVPNHFNDGTSNSHLSYVGVTLASKSSRRRRSEDDPEDFFADYEDIYAAFDAHPEENRHNPYAHSNM